MLKKDQDALKISLCTTSMNRLGHLQHTLPRNIKDNEDYDNLEFVVLNYNSTDDMDEWIKDNYMGLIKEGRLVYVHEKTATYFLPPHSRNVSLRCASGDIICNVDADNFTRESFAAFLAEIFEDRPHPVIANSYDEEWLALSTHGRLAMWRRDFLCMGGYDEAMIGWGAEDWDLNNRCLLANFERFEIPERHFRVIDHDDGVRVENCDFQLLESVPEDKEERKDAANQINCDRMRWKQQQKFYVANVGKCWGKAVVERNFSETVALGNPWITL